MQSFIEQNRKKICPILTFLKKKKNNDTNFLRIKSYKRKIMITKKGNKEGNNVRGEKKIQAKVLIEEKKKIQYIYIHILLHFKSFKSSNSLCNSLLFSIKMSV